jgi:hypothetical protein
LSSGCNGRRVLENSIVRAIFGRNVAEQWLLKGYVIKIFRICTLQDRLIIIDKGRSFEMCVCVGGGGGGSGEAKCIGASEFRSWHLRLKWMEEESHVEKMQAHRVQNLFGKRRKLGKTGRTWQIILKWMLRTGTECEL